MKDTSPRICFGQQPCGFFPRRFLYAKIVTARRLQREIGGEIVFFYHDSDHDPRETQTILTHRKTGERATLNFNFVNKIQRKWSPLCHKQIAPGWHDKTLRQLPAYVDAPLVEIFKQTHCGNVADFCLDVYTRMGLLDGSRLLRSGDAAGRAAACEIPDRFADVLYENERVRARIQDGAFRLHEGGDFYVTIPCSDPPAKEQISPTRDTRLRWMQSVIGCTHYVCGAGEQAYLNHAEAPEIRFLQRDPIDRSDEAFTDQPDFA